MTEMSVFDAYARSLGNALVLKGLIELLRNKGVVSATEVQEVLRDASAILSSRPSVPSIRALQGADKDHTPAGDDGSL
jgi:hypothetical protein